MLATTRTETDIDTTTRPGGHTTTRDALAAPVILLVLAVLGRPCSVRELDYHLGVYSPGEPRLLTLLTSLARKGDLVTTDRSEPVDGHPDRVAVFSLPR